MLAVIKVVIPDHTPSTASVALSFARSAGVTATPKGGSVSIASATPLAVGSKVRVHWL